MAIASFFQYDLGVERRRAFLDITAMRQNIENANALYTSMFTRSKKVYEIAHAMLKKGKTVPWWGEEKHDSQKARYREARRRKQEPAFVKHKQTPRRRLSFANNTEHLDWTTLRILGVEDWL